MNGQSTLASHTLSVYVANKPGVLARIAQVFARRGFNIDSLVVSPSMEGQFSRMTITAVGDASGLGQIIHALQKLIDVIRCVDHTGEEVAVKELALIKIAVGVESRGEVLQIVDHFAAKTVDLTDKSLIIMGTGNTDKLDAMIGLLRKFKIVELVRTGKVLMARGEEET
jgi:acetolactate synthase I/III small subunit